MTTYLGKSCSFGLPRVPFVNCRQFMYLVISLLVLRAGCGIWLYQFLIIAYLFTFYRTGLHRFLILAFPPISITSSIETSTCTRWLHCWGLMTRCINGTMNCILELSLAIGSLDMHWSTKNNIGLEDRLGQYWYSLVMNGSIVNNCIRIY